MRTGFHQILDRLCVLCSHRGPGRGFAIVHVALTVVAATLLAACSGPVDPGSPGDAGAEPEPFTGILVTSSADSGPGSLRQAVIDAEPGEEIRFASDMTIVLQGDRRGIEVDKDITISGVGRTVVIEGSGAQRHFTHMPGGPFDLTLAHLTLRNGEPRMGTLLPGGSIYIGAGSTATIENVIFTDNLGTNGGAIFAERVDGRTTTLTIRDSVFESNEARGATGVAQPAGSGGALYAWNVDLVVNTSEFRSNFVDTGNTQLPDAISGGAISVNTTPGQLSTATIRTSHFESNTAGLYGGAIRAYDANLTVLTSTFVGNRAGVNGNDDHLEWGTGGAVSFVGSGAQRELRIGRSRFTRNGAGGPDNNASASDRMFTGGAVSVVNAGLTVHSSEFFGNVAEDGGATGSDPPSAPNGGSAIYVQSAFPVVIAGSAFVGNTVRGANYGSLAFDHSAAVAIDDLSVTGLADVRLSTFAENVSSGPYPHFRFRVQDVYLSSIALLDDQVDFTASWQDDGYTIGHVVAPIPFADFDLDSSSYANVQAVPGFVRNPSPGADTEWGTNDDDYGNLSPSAGSNLRGAGRNNDLLQDVMDLDSDGNTSESMPLDAGGNPRLDGTVDAGGYEG
jgi:predicted outer membrane repeat protein